MSETQNKIKVKINELRKLHSELDIEISKIVKVIPVDQVMLQRIKKKKLKLKDEISKLISNNPEKKRQLEMSGQNVASVVPVMAGKNLHNTKYLSSKKEKGHLISDRYLDTE